MQRRVGRSDDQKLTAGTVAHLRDGIGLGQRGECEQSSDLRRRSFRLGGPAAGLAYVDEADRLRASALFSDVAEKPRLLRARDDDVAGCVIGECAELLLA